MQRPCLHVLILSYVLAVEGSLLGADWPTYRHDNQRTGVTSESLAPPLSLRWVFRSPFPPARGWSLPVNGYGAIKHRPNVCYDDAFHVTSVGGAAYFCSSSENRLYAVDAATGAVRWTFFTGASPRLAQAVHDGRLYFGADDGIVYCLDAEGGRVIWSLRGGPTGEKMLGQGRFLSLWPVRSGVLVENGVAYFTAGLFPSEGVYFYAVNTADGTLLWRKDLDEGGMGGPSPQGCLLASADSLYMTSRVAPTRWNLADGTQIPFDTPTPRVKDDAYRFYNGGTEAQLWGKNIVYGNACILGFDPDKVLVDKYGRQRKGDLVFNWFNARQALFDNGVAYLATDDHLLAVDQGLLPELSKAECARFEEAYKEHGVAEYLSALEAVAEHGEDSPVGRHLANTRLKWGKERFQSWPAAAEKLFEQLAARCRWMLPGNVTDALIMAGNVLYAGGANEVVAVDAATGKRLWSDRTASRVRGLAVANQRLFVSTVDGNVRCYAPGPGVNSPTEIRSAGRTPDSSPADGLSAFYASTAKAIAGGGRAKSGYCLILGGGAGRLAHEIAARTDLSIAVLEPDAGKVAEERTALANAGLYGGRITVEQASLERLPFPPYVFNLVIQEEGFFGGRIGTPPEELLRVTKPCGGIAYVGQPPGGEKFGRTLGAAGLATALQTRLAERGATLTFDGAWAKIVRGKIEQSKDWTHNYATAANTYCSEDPLVKAPFGILWYGEPGPRKRIERHATGPVPLVVGGIMFLEGYDLLMAYDIYNGQPYWERAILGATRTGLPLGTSNLAADEHSLFVVVDDRECLRLDARTGETIETYPAPTKDGAKHDFWGWIARDGDLLFGSRPRFDPARKRADPKTSDAVFAIEVSTGRLRWTVDAEGVEHDGIAVADGKLFLVERNLTDAEGREALAATVRDPSVRDREPVDRKGNRIEPDLRKLAAIDVKTGKRAWQTPINATDITLDDVVVSEGRVAVACMVKDGVVVVHGTGSLGHPHREFLQGEFARRALYAYSSDTGKFLWGGRRNYQKRPIVAGEFIYAEPFAWNLKTGEPKRIANPLSGREDIFDFHRGYVGCGHLLASGAALVGNRNGIACDNLDERVGFAPFANMSLACGLGVAPAGGVLVAPEGRSGCTCATEIFTSIVLYPREKARAWGAGVTGGMATPDVLPVRHVAINLGAPGFREDARHNLWIPYPAKGGMGIIGDWLPKYQHDDSMFYRQSEDFFAVECTEQPWIFTSGYRHTKPLAFQLIGKGQSSANYTVRLYFAEPRDVAPGDRVFDVSLQNNVVLKDFDIVKEAGGPRKALVREFKGIKVTDSLVVGMAPADRSRVKEPILCGIEALVEDDDTRRGARPVSPVQEASASAGRRRPR